MTAVTVPGARRSLIGKLGTALNGRSRAKGRPSKIAEALAVARAHVMTAAALAAADLGGFTVFHHGGWFVAAVSILALHFDVSG